MPVVDWKSERKPVGRQRLNIDTERGRTFGDAAFVLLLQRRSGDQDALRVP